MTEPQPHLGLNSEPVVAEQLLIWQISSSGLSEGKLATET